VLKPAQLQRSGFSCSKTHRDGLVPVPTVTQNCSSGFDPLLTLPGNVQLRMNTLKTFSKTPAKIHTALITKQVCLTSLEIMQVITLVIIIKQEEKLNIA